MSQDEPKLSRKERRAQRDTERFQQGKKRKHAETVDNPAGDRSADGGNDLEEDFIALPADNDPESSGPSAQSKRKGKSADKERQEQNVKGNVKAEAALPSRKKQKRQQGKGTGTADGEQGGETAKHRFILFVGNLPYNTSDESLKLHFKKLEPFTLRHRLDKQTKKSKGFAFLEFENYDRMKTCLKLYHHTLFDPETAGQTIVGEGGEDQGDDFHLVQGAAGRGNKKSKARKINVELTAGGGGSTDARKEKIRVKNVRLEEQRKRRAEQEKKDKTKADRKKGTGASGANAAVNGDVAGAAGAEGQGDVVDSGMHPSRQAMMQR